MMIKKYLFCVFLLGALAMTACTKKEASVTPDLMLGDVFGPVKSVEIAPYKYCYDPAGSLTEIIFDGMPVEINRNDKGYVESTVTTEFQKVSYSYDEQGRLTGYSSGWEDGSCEVAYEYEGHFIRKSIAKISEFMLETGEHQESTSETEYTYPEVDDHGNWIVRTFESENGTTVTDQRTIEYYE